MRMVRWICGNAQKDRLWNEEICLTIGVAPIIGKKKKGRVTWNGLVMFKGEWLMQW